MGILKGFRRLVVSFDVQDGFLYDVHIAKSTLTEPLFNLKSVTIEDFYVGDTLSGRLCLF